MTWIANPPTESGYYWHRHHGSDLPPVILEVRFTDDGHPPEVYRSGDEWPDPLAGFGGSWYGPLAPPD